MLKNSCPAGGLSTEYHLRGRGSSFHFANWQQAARLDAGSGDIKRSEQNSKGNENLTHEPRPQLLRVQTEPRWFPARSNDLVGRCHFHISDPNPARNPRHGYIQSDFGL